MKKDSKANLDVSDRIVGNCIVLDGQGDFPKIVKITQGEECREYLLRKTGKGNFILNGK